MKTHTTEGYALPANESYIPHSAVIGGKDYIKNPSRAIGGGLWLEWESLRPRQRTT